MDDKQQPKQKQHPLTDNWISIGGFMLAVVFLAGEAIIIAMDMLQHSTHPYVGILIYLVGPTILVCALLCIPLGMWLEHRKRQRNKEIKALPVFDLNNPRHRFNMSVFLGISTIFVVLSMIGSYNAYHLTESNEFCGITCHQVMMPEYVAFQNSPHARVGCVECHIGPGADWFVKSKLSGVGQVFAVLTDNYHTPIHTPVENLRPARETCEQCHWPEKFFESVQKTLVYYGSDEENTPYKVDLLLKVGQSSTNPEEQGIHWHIGLDHTLEYYASDEDRQDIPWVRVTYDDGRVVEYRNDEGQEFDPSSVPPEEIRTMDCIDCHNRPSHRFNSPFMALNHAMELGKIDPKIPEVKVNVFDLLQAEYETKDEAVATIEEQLTGIYADWIGEDEDRQQRIAQVIEQAQDIYSKNIFPEWGVDWTQFQWNIGHFEFEGCYRCHDDQHVSSGGETISFDCNQCHTIVRQGEGWDEIENLEYGKQDFYHPRGFGEDWGGGNCHECHGPGMM